VSGTRLAPDAAGPTLCVGEILVEIVATTAGEGFLEPQPLTGPFPSGAPAIFADQCGRFGGTVAMIGAVGDDDFGRINLDRLRRDGVDVTGIAIDPGVPTGSAFVRYRHDGSRDFVYNIATSAAARFGWNAATEAVANRCAHLHVMGSALSMPGAWAVIEPAARAIRARGGSVSLDPNLRKELVHDRRTADRFRQLVVSCDLLLPSGEELEHAAGLDGVRGTGAASERDDAQRTAAAIVRLFELGVGEIALKRGERGASVFLPDGRRADAAGFTVDELDPTGAGDCFGAAYLTCRRLGLPVERALDYGCAAGARNVTVLGPMEGAGTRAQLDAFMRATPRRP